MCVHAFLSMHLSLVSWYPVVVPMLLLFILLCLLDAWKCVLWVCSLRCKKASLLVSYLRCSSSFCSQAVLCEHLFVVVTAALDNGLIFFTPWSSLLDTPFVCTFLVLRRMQRNPGRRSQPANPIVTVIIDKSGITITGSHSYKIRLDGKAARTPDPVIMGFALTANAESRLAAMVVWVVKKDSGTKCLEEDRSRCRPGTIRHV